MVLLYLRLGSVRETTPLVLTCAYWNVLIWLLLRLYTGLSALTMLSLFSAAVKDTIGIIYICPANVNIRFAYLDFWGRRNNYDTTVDNIVVRDGKGIRGLYQLVKLRDGAKTFKLYTRHGLITDFDMYERLFGPLRK